MLIEHLNRQLLERDANALRQQQRVVESPCAPHVRLARDDGPDASMLAFCSNDYLGLAGSAAIGAALAQGALQWGAGSGASHLISGHSRAHVALEEELAQWLAPCIPEGKAITFSTGYMANIALLTALGDAQATIFADKLNHASLIDGALLAKAPMQRFPHGRTDLLATQLERCTTPIRLIVTDAVFSMDGDLAPMTELLALAERFDAWLVVDDAHGFGVLGEEGGGTLSHFGLCSERFIYMGTLGKAVGLCGAFVVAHATVIDWLVQASRPYIYTTAAPPAIAHAARASLQVIRSGEGSRRRAKLAVLVGLLRQRLGELVDQTPGCSWRLADSITAIQPLIVGDNDAALALSAVLEAKGLWVPAIRPPTVPAGTARLRITLGAAHTEADVLRLVDALAQAAKELSPLRTPAHVPSSPTPRTT